MKKNQPVKLYYQLSLDAKKMYKAFNTTRAQFKRFGSSVKSMFLGMQLGRYLFSGASAYMEEFKAKARSIMNFKDLGFSQQVSEEIFKITNNFEQLGYSADTANDAMLQFISSGRATALRNIGIYLEKNTQSTLSNATAQDRLNWILANGNQKYKEMTEALPENVQILTRMTKQADDLKKVLGASFLSAINSISNAFGGLANTLTIAIVAFTAYRTAVIVGNIAIGISKALALGSVFALPLALAMGAAAIVAIGSLIGTAGIAISSLHSGAINNPNTASTSSNNINNNVIVEVNQDPYGNIVKQTSGGKTQTTQTTYGSGTHEY